MLSGGGKVKTKMKTISGQLCFTKTEVKNIELMLKHVMEDLSYGGGGTFNLGDNENSFDTKNASKVVEAIDDIKWILSNSIIK